MCARDSPAGHSIGSQRLACYCIHACSVHHLQERKLDLQLGVLAVTEAFLSLLITNFIWYLPALRTADGVPYVQFMPSGDLDSYPVVLSIQGPYKTQQVYAQMHAEKEGRDWRGGEGSIWITFVPYSVRDDCDWSSVVDFCGNT